MNQKKLRKLSLNRETLMPLNTDSLDDVNGGTGALCRLSVRACSQVAKSIWESIKGISASYSFYKATQEATNSGK